MAPLTIAVACLIISLNTRTSSGQDALNVRIINPGGASFEGTLHLVYDDVEDVVCEIANADKIPAVTFGFKNSVKFPDAPDVVTTATNLDGKFNVNVTMTFKVLGTMNHEFLECKFDDQEWTAYMDLYFPPLLRSHGFGGHASDGDNKVEMHCESISVPRTLVEWKMNGVPLLDTDIQNTVNQVCTQVSNDNYESSSMKFRCRSDLTLRNLSKADIGSNVTCSYSYRGETIKETLVSILNYLYRPDNVTVTATPTKAVQENSNGTVALTCKTAAANDEPSLHWYRGSNTLSNRLVFDQYPVSITNVDYNGHIASQTVELSVTKDMNGDIYTCCADMSWDYRTEVCGSTNLNVAWLFNILEPRLNEYMFYVGSNVSIPCIVDSNPTATLMWKNPSSQTLNDGSNTNNLELKLTNVQKAHAGYYTCQAALHVDGFTDAMHEVSKIIAVRVYDPPTMPVLSVNVPNIVIQTAQTAPPIPQTYFIQYRKLSGTLWMEISQTFSDTLPGQGSQRHDFDMTDADLPAGEYQVRVKALSQTGLITYSEPKTFQIKKSEPDTVSKTAFNNAIVISVLVTAVIFVIITVVLVCLVKRGTFCSSSSTGNSWNVS